MVDFTPLESFLKQFPKTQLPKGNLKRLGKSFYLITPHLQAIIDAISQRPESAGLFLGEEKKGHFLPSANLLAYLVNHDSWIKLDQKTAWLFVCGRDVFLKSTIDHSPEYKGLVVVKNERDEVLGLAKMQKKDNIFKNIVDLGYFLRKEK